MHLSPKGIPYSLSGKIFEGRTIPYAISGGLYFSRIKPRKGDLKIFRLYGIQ